MKTEVLEKLWGVILDRKKSPKKGSYTNKMIENPEKLYGKILEESSELVDAAKESRFSGKDSLSWEAADMIYHTMVLFAAKGRDFSDVLTELESRMK
jgi:phosphoribosyl-ATP pyrophosphohydrolase/phosphoribosyl-AMP cyclohydrolase